METTPTCAIPTCDGERVGGTSFCSHHGPKAHYRAPSTGKATKTVNASGVLVCTKCGGSQFKAKRSTGGKVAFGLLAKKTRVQCVTCGASSTRG